MKPVCSLILALLVLPVQAGQTWVSVHEDEHVTVAVDTAGLEQRKKHISFRERHTLKQAQTDPNSLRNIVEIQMRRQVDCARHKLATLSRAMFSDKDALVHYESVKLEQINGTKSAWNAPANAAEAAVMQFVCGGKPAAQIPEIGLKTHVS